MTSKERKAFASTRAFFEQELGLEPAEETPVYLLYSIPKSEEPRLPAFFACGTAGFAAGARARLIFSTGSGVASRPWERWWKAP